MRDPHWATGGPEAMTSESTSQRAARGIAILLVEDAPDNRDLATIVFRRHGYAVTPVTTGQAALDAVAENDFDIIALDIRLPDLDGLEVARRMRENPRLARVPIVAITALAMKGDRELAFEAGCDAYITKPVDTRTLAEDIERIYDTFHARS